MTYLLVFFLFSGIPYGRCNNCHYSGHVKLIDDDDDDDDDDTELLRPILLVKSLEMIELSFEVTMLRML